MQNENYRSSLAEAVQVLQDVENQVFTAMVNVGFAGEYQDISQLHEPGEVIDLELAMFEDTNDQNLSELADLVKQIAEVKLRIINLNALEIEEEE